MEKDSSTPSMLVIIVALNERKALADSARAWFRRSFI